MDLALPRVVGHRGAALRAPENTLTGLRAAARLGVAWVEFDVMLSGDGVPLLHHDHDLKRTTGKDDLVGLLPYVEIAKLDAGAWFHEGYVGEPVPRLEDAIGLLGQLGLGANVEIKPAAGRARETANATIDLLLARWPDSLPPPLISSFDSSVLAVARDRAPQLPRGLLARGLPADWRHLAGDFDCVTIHLDHRDVRANEVVEVRAAGYGLAVYTVNDPVEARWLFAWGVDSIITDVPDDILAVAP